MTILHDQVLLVVLNEETSSYIRAVCCPLPEKVEPNTILRNQLSTGFVTRMCENESRVGCED